jgi:hypothetical protein
VILPRLSETGLDDFLSTVCSVKIPQRILYVLLLSRRSDYIPRYGVRGVPSEAWMAGWLVFSHR